MDTNKVGNELFFFLLSSGYLQGIFGINAEREKALKTNNIN